jgi:NOL1/NOP2/fmu family ribosome biogenesis protein
VPLQNGEFITATFTDTGQIDDVSRTISEIGFSMLVKSLSEDGWTLDRPEVLDLMKKLRKRGTPLGEYVKGRFYYGIKTGFNEAFVIDEETKKRLIKEDPKSKEIIRPWLRGRDIKKWKAEWAGLYIIAIPSSANREWPWTGKPETKAEKIFSETYAVLHEHLRQYTPQLKKRDDQGEFWWELRSCAYYAEFERPKIVYAEIATEGKFLLDHEGYYSDTTSYIIANDSKYLLSVLNSRLFTYMFSKTSAEISGGFYRWKRQYMEQIPIFPATDKQNAPITKRVEAILKNPDGQDVARLEREIDEEIFRLYGLTDKEIRLIEEKRQNG